MSDALLVREAVPAGSGTMPEERLPEPVGGVLSDLAPEPAPAIPAELPPAMHAMPGVGGGLLADRFASLCGGATTLWKAAALPALAFIIFVAIWQAGVSLAKLPPATLPGPLDVSASLVHDWRPLLINAAWTTRDALGGFALAATLGLALGLAMNTSVLLREMLYPNLIALQVIPKIALAPVFIVWFGIGFESKLLLATFISFFPVAIATATGLMETDAGALRLCRALRASHAQTLFQVRLPYALPFIFSGLKIASTLAMIGVIVAEFISAQRGLGFMITNASSRLDTPQVIAAIVVLCAAGMAMYALTDLIERAARKRWWPQ